jgi:hypothetical protein
MPAGLMQRTPYPELDPVGFLSHGFPSKPIYASLEFETPTKVTLGPGESTVVSFTVTPPTGLDPDTIPLYSGYIRFVSGRDVYHVPYMGLTYVINQVPVMERDPIKGLELPLMIEKVTDFGEPIYAEGDVVTYNLTKGDYIHMVYFARQPSDVFRLDVVAANTSFVPTYYGFNKYNIIETSTPDLLVIDDLGGAESFTTVFYDVYMPPVYHYLSSYGGLSGPDGQDLGLLPPGDYRWLLRLLLLEKDPEDAESWTSWLGPVIRIPEA